MPSPAAQPVPETVVSSLFSMAPMSAASFPPYYQVLTEVPPDQNPLNVKKIMHESVIFLHRQKTSDLYVYATCPSLLACKSLTGQRWDILIIQLEIQV